MKGLVQAQTIEDDRSLARLAATHQADAREAVGGRARQALNYAQRLCLRVRLTFYAQLPRQDSRVVDEGQPRRT
ncbi:MAG TPA: hypothetical protein VJS12_09010 [Steroidobacteraceae bacterium]|nr:hypothetical protein [Steroidobacteraceae bacterium]